MKYESNILKRLIDTYGVVGNPRYISEIIKEFIVQGKERFPNLFTYQGDWLAHIDEFGLNPSYFVSYTGQSIYAPNTLERPVKSAILKGNTGYRDIDTGEFLETFEEGRNLELVSVKMPVLKSVGKNLFDMNIMETSKTGDGWTYERTENLIHFTSDGTKAYQQYKLDITNHLANKIKLGEPYSFTSDTSKNITNDAVSVCQLMITNKDGSKLYYDAPRVFTLNKEFSQIDIRIIGHNHNEVGIPSDYTIKNIQLEEGYIATPCEPYKSNILTVNEPVELRGIGEVKDVLNCLTGEVVERIGEVVFDGSADEGWGVASEGDTINGFSIWKNIDNAHHKGLVCDKLSYFDYSDLKNDKTQFISCINQARVIVVNIKGLTSVDEVKQWLSENPITVQYQLATESIKTVDLSILDQNGQNIKQLMSFNGGTHFNTGSLEGSLIPSVSVTVETDLEETLKVCSIEGNTM